MERMNQTIRTEFFILGFSNLPELKPFLSLMFFILYLLVVIGNLLILELVYLDPCLHTPMYFFISNLSFLDICYTSVTLPEAMIQLYTEQQYVSLGKCMTQLYFFISLASTEVLLLTVMAYDRYVAVCNPLRYVLIMNKKACSLLATSAWLVGFLDPVVYTLMTAQLSFCGSMEIDHFFCELQSILKLSCSDIHLIQHVIYTYGTLIVFSAFILTLTSYVLIVAAILKIQSTGGRYKAFSTCSSHLIMIILFYVTIIFVNMRPTSASSRDYDKFISLLYVVLIPLVNPIVYSLKNKEMKRALTKCIMKTKLGKANAFFTKKSSQ